MPQAQPISRCDVSGVSGEAEAYSGFQRTVYLSTASAPLNDARVDNLRIAIRGATMVLVARAGAHRATSRKSDSCTVLRPAIAPARAPRRPPITLTRPQSGSGEGDASPPLPLRLPAGAKPAPLVDAGEGPDDAWDDERFELLGKLSSTIIPVLLLVALVFIGVFASSTYNDGATLFLSTPTSETSSATLVPAQQLRSSPDE